MEEQYNDEKEKYDKEDGNDLNHSDSGKCFLNGLPLILQQEPYENFDF